jgi:hypothetical protein
MFMWKVQILGTYNSLLSIASTLKFTRDILGTLQFWRSLPDLVSALNSTEFLHQIEVGFYRVTLCVPVDKLRQLQIIQPLKCMVKV